MTCKLIVLLILSIPNVCLAWIAPSSFTVKHHQHDRRQQQCHSTATTIHNQILTRRSNMLSDWMTGGSLQNVNELPYSPSLSPTMRLPRTFAMQERAISWTGEDFDVSELTERGSTPFMRVRGAMLHLPGKDKMRLFNASGTLVAELDRKLVALTPTYDIYRSNNENLEKLGWMERKMIALSDTFEVHLQGSKGGFYFIKPPAAYYLEGDFLDRRFVMENDKHQVVAKVTKEGWIQFDAFNHYQIQVAAGMDPGLVIACACAIDEEFDEEHKERAKQRKEQEAGGRWPF
ncbi:hypothetical protein MPSEU_000331400 [Mayamaea pseudoterrestris]|nr:hypothetical protein MPSEU_000331400 [Mayamaea pseudoterrestris]